MRIEHESRYILSGGESQQRIQNKTAYAQTPPVMANVCCYNVSYTGVIFDEIRATNRQMTLIPGAQALQAIFYAKRVRRPNTLYIDWHTVANLMWSTVRIITQQHVAILVKRIRMMSASK